MSIAGTTSAIGGREVQIADRASVADGIVAAAHAIRETAHIHADPETGRFGVVLDDEASLTASSSGSSVVAVLPPLYPEWLGDRSFTEVHNTRFAYVSGAMANGIATPGLVTEMAEAGCLGFFGAGGLDYRHVEKAVHELSGSVGAKGLPWGCNLIHSPHEPQLEQAVAELYIQTRVRKVSAAAYMSLTPAIVQYAYSGLHLDSAGQMVRPNMVFAKISRPEVARHFMNPAPRAIIDRLVSEQRLTPDEARLAAFAPVAEDFTVESDSGGHTDNRPLAPLFSSIQAVRSEVMTEHNYPRPIRLGAAGGIGTPQSAAAAFALGASYILTGTINQACVESGLADDGKAMLANASLADVTMAPAADMFELGVELQVLKRGTMFAPRAKMLYQLYRTYDSLDALPAEAVAEVESKVLGMTIAQSWASTREFWLERDPSQISRADSDPRHKMALVFRSYLGLSSRWAINGHADRRLDYQIWCGPAMGAFNAWTAGSFLAEPANRTVTQVAKNLLEGAAVLTRAHQFRTYGVDVPIQAFDFRPRRLV